MADGQLSPNEVMDIESSTPQCNCFGGYQEEGYVCFKMFIIYNYWYCVLNLN